MTLSPDTLTLVAPLKPGAEEVTRNIIRSSTDPGWLDQGRRWMIPREDDPAEGPDTGTRLGALNFDDFPGLHCCALFVLDGASKPAFLGNTSIDLKPYLILEATIDGSVEDFVRDLVDHSAEHLVMVFQHCEGLPENAVAQPDLLVDFLLRRRVRHNTYFSGVPGKSVSEIKSEQELRTFLTRALQRTFFPTDQDGKAVQRPKARFRDIQRRMRNLVRNEPSLNLAEQRSRKPWSIQHGRTAMKVGGFLLAVAVVPVICLLFWLAGLGHSNVLAGVRTITQGTFPTMTAWLGGLILAWLVLRCLRIVVTPGARQRLERGPFYLIDTWLNVGTMVARVTILLIGLTMILDHTAPTQTANEQSFWLDLASWVGVMLLWLGGLVVGLLFMFRIKALRAGPRRQVENGPHVLPASRRSKAKLRALVDVANLVHLIWYLLITAAVVVFVNPLISLIYSDWVADALWSLEHLVTLALYWTASAALLLALKHGFLVLAHLLQKHEDRHRFASAEKLAEHNINRDHIWAREEHRTHMNQNHFASETLVKSWPRMLYLRASLMLINLFARYWDNRGKLGGIPTIFSARWLLLDNGHRLVFMTNYVGAWDSYLGEFSDLSAYIGVNAIWTNTYLPLTDDQKRQLGTGERDVGFPTSRFMLFGGACLEQPFKAYVRQSQVETLAWYGAYPRLSVPNIHDNARIRDDLFQDLSVDRLDALFRRI